MRVAAGIAAFTLVEDLGLVAWLALVRAGGMLQKVLGAAVLPVAFFVEHVIAQRVKGGPLTKQILGRILVNAVLESVVWIVWLLLWSIYPISIFGIGIPVYAIVWLQLTLIIEHSLTDNIFHGRPLYSNLFNRKVLGFSTVENVAATGWLGLVGAGLPVLGILWLVIWQYEEHAQAINLARST